MIKLKPSKAVRESFNIDFEVLSRTFSTVLNMIYGFEVYGEVRVLRSKTWCYYTWSKNKGSRIRVSLDANKSDLDLISTLVHEMRHWQQNWLFSMDLDDPACSEDATDEVYRNSTIEIDARYFEKLETQVAALYKTLLEVKKMNVEFNFSKFFEKPKN